jgi:DNA-binding response OmpR family regulator
VAKNKQQHGAVILVVADLEYLRDGIKALLEADGHRIHTARYEEDAIDTAMRVRPDLILITLDHSPDYVTAFAREVRARANLSDTIPIVMFCIPTIAEGAEVPIGECTYATRPINFNQLRRFLRRLLVPVPAVL